MKSKKLITVTVSGSSEQGPAGEPSLNTKVLGLMMHIFHANGVEVTKWEVSEPTAFVNLMAYGNSADKEFRKLAEGVVLKAVEASEARVVEATSAPTPAPAVNAPVATTPNNRMVINQDRFELAVKIEEMMEQDLGNYSKKTQEAVASTYKKILDVVRGVETKKDGE